MMGKWTCRLTGIFTAAMLLTTCMPAEQAFADNAAADTFEMSIWETSSRKDTISVSTLDLAEGDVTLRLGIYIQSADWEDYDYIEAASANWTSSDYSLIHFENIDDLTAVQEQTTVTYSGGEYSTRYVPYCFASVAALPKGAREMNRPINATTTKIAYDPTFGAEIYQAGYNQIQFRYTYYESYQDKQLDMAADSRDRMKTRDCVCDVQYNSSGEAYYEYDYIRQDDYETVSAVGYIPMYDPNAEVGTNVPGLCNFLMWLYKGSSETAFFGESSDEFPLVTFDAVIAQDTPEGIYHIDFLANDKTFLTGMTTRSHQPASANGLTIVVDENAPRMTEPVVTTVTEDVQGDTTETTAVSDDLDDPDVDMTTNVSTDGWFVGDDEEETMTLPLEEPKFLEDGCTMYVGEERDVLIHNTYNDPIAWVLSAQDVVSLDGTYGEYAFLTAQAPGTVTLYAVVGGKTYPYEITVLADDGAYFCGDINRDNRITLMDLVLLTKYMSGSVDLGYYAKCNADCNADSDLDLTDVVVLQEFLVRMLPSIPAEPI